MSGHYVGVKTGVDLYMEQRKQVFAYLQARSEKGKLNKWRVTVEEVLENIDVDHGFSVRDQMKQFFIEQARKKTLGGGKFTSVNDKSSTEETSETTETERQEESNQTESTTTASSEEDTETTTTTDSDGVGDSTGKDA